MLKFLGRSNKLAKKVLVYVILCSSVLSISSTAVQLYIEYQESIQNLEERFENIESSYLEAISSSLWDFNETLVNQQIHGIVNLPDIVYVEIKTTFDDSFSAGNKDHKVKKQAVYPIIYGDDSIGTLIVSASYDDIETRLEQHAKIIIVSEFLKIFFVALVLIIIVHMMITRHIYHITRYSKDISGTNLNRPLILFSRSKNEDELDELAQAINDMRTTILDEIVKLETAENELIQLSGELEIKVFERTEELQKSNGQLQQSLADLTLAKDQLVQSEKMASLGQLVAGVAHEVNTPLGICVTSVSALKEKVQVLMHDIEEGKLTKTNLTNTLNLLIEYQEIIEKSLTKAVELIRSFKSVAVEQHTDPEIKINMAKHVDDVVNTVKTMFKRKSYEIDINIDENLEINTFPSAWNQILTNFLMNTHIHGFEGREDGKIGISFSVENGSLVFDYTDDGKGISPSLKQKIFDPFVTTKRGQGGTGLGLNIVYNLITSKLHGSIEIKDAEMGVHFRVKIPYTP